MFNEKNISELMNQAKNIQEKINTIQKSIKNTEVIGISAAGLVKITLTGTYDCKEVDINKEIIRQDEKNILEDLIAAAFNDAIKKILDIQKDKLTLQS